MIDRILEVVSFRLIEGGEDAGFVEAAREVNDVLRAMPGFLNRRLIKTDDRHWTDIVEWTDLESARHAAEKLHQQPGAQGFCSMIDMGSVAMADHAVLASAEAVP